MRRAQVDEVDLEVVDLGGELGHGVQPPRHPIHLVLALPVGAEVPRVGERQPLRPVVDGLGVGPARPRQPLAQVGDLALADLDSEWRRCLDRGTLCRMGIDDGMVVAHFIVSDDVERSRRFYTDVLGGETVIGGEAGDQVTYVALANSWVIINVGGGPTDDKPTVTLETPPDPDRVSSFLNIRVADIQAVYEEWSARGAEFLTPPKQHETEIRCYIRDPDGYIIEVGQTTLDRGWRPPS
jgi:catechol 2,3-dioxygenase-like lactoylglutathione lyase family enzyme